MGVEVVLHDVGETGTCRQALRTDAAGHASASLCADAPYVVEVSRGLVVWPQVTGASSVGVPSIVVWDVPEAEGLYIVGEGQVVPLSPMVFLRLPPINRILTTLVSPLFSPTNNYWEKKARPSWLL